MGFNPLRPDKTINKEAERIVNDVIDEWKRQPDNIDRSFDEYLGIDDPGVRNVFAPETLFSDRNKEISDRSEIPQAGEPGFDPFAVDESSVIGSQLLLRKRLANKKGLSSANVTGGGLRTQATGQRGSLFTFS